MSLFRTATGIPVSIPGSLWDRLLTLSWAVVLLAFAFASFVPPSNWLDVESVVIDNTKAGAPIIMHVDRTIHQDFAGNWLVEVERLGAHGGFYMYCSSTGQAAYRTDAEYPSPLTLDWWTYPTKCALPPGKYRVETTWGFSPTWFSAKTVRVLSNVFTVS